VESEEEKYRKSFAVVKDLRRELAQFVRCTYARLVGLQERINADRSGGKAAELQPTALIRKLR
jgi:hypothetical protein